MIDRFEENQLAQEPRKSWNNKFYWTMALLDTNVGEHKMENHKMKLCVLNDVRTG